MTAQIIPFPKAPRPVPIRPERPRASLPIGRSALPDAGMWQGLRVYHKPSASKGRCIGRAPCGGLRLLLPEGRTIDVSASDCWRYTQHDKEFDWS